MSDIELKPCPRCGGESSFGVVRYGKTRKPNAWFADGAPVEIVHYVNCIQCSLANRTIVGGFQTQVLAAQYWNTRPAIERAIAEAVAAERERCVEYCRERAVELDDTVLSTAFVGDLIASEISEGVAIDKARPAEAIRSAAK
ncbi:MAG: Lar family restriction alleviation protein [Acetobacter malorum]|uniref:Lar family restriction alleviation protein n=1 Tax=Acetobacter malorum TaxID=178901 RepID=UPI0039EBED3B